MTNRRQGRWSAVNALMRPYRLKVAGLSAVSAAGGVAEAAFLVLVTQAALALAGGDSGDLDVGKAQERPGQAHGGHCGAAGDGVPALFQQEGGADGR